MHMPDYMAPDADIVIFGHTHEFEIDVKNGTLFLNPGEVCARNKSISECAMLEDTDATFEVTYYTKEKKEDTFKHQKFSYERIKS
jgi:putative phosphoesterase